MTPSIQTDLYVTWTQYHRLIEALALQIHNSGWAFDHILCLARGGLRIGDILSRLYNCPLAILSASSYYGENSRTRGSVQIANALTTSESNLGERILLVDDLVDSGETLIQTLDWLTQNHQISSQNCRTAVLWYKACSQVIPDYYSEYLPSNPWIHQPFEKYEQETLEVLKAKFQNNSSMPHLPD